MARKLRRYKFSGLPRLTRQQVGVVNTLLCHLPQTPFEAGFKDRLRQTLEPLVRADVDVWFDGVVAVEPGDLQRTMSEPTCAAIIGLPPRADRVILEIDLGIAQQSIDRMLGGAAEDTDGQRPLSEIEEGVFSYILLKVIKLVHESFGGERQLGLKLEGMVGSHEALAERIQVQTRWVALNFKLFFDLKVGYFRIYLPADLVMSDMPATVPASGPAADRYWRRAGERVGLLHTLRTALTVEVGRLSLALADVEALEADDIVLIEATEVRLQDGSAQGRVDCRVGDGGHGIISGNVVVGESGKYEIAIEQITPVGEPRARAFLFRDDPEGAEMKSEYARRLSLGRPADAERAARQMRNAVVDRVRAGGTQPLASARADEPAGSEHSDAYDEENPDEENAEGYGDAPSPESAGLLEDITVALVVELGRVMVSAADVMGLRPGQVIELSRKPGDAVDLVVDGKRIGKGELVEIDGELGVRILSLAK